MADELLRINARRCARCLTASLHKEDEPFCIDCMDEAEETEARALSAAEAAVVKAAEEWHAHQVEHGCKGNHEPTLEALRSACRELAERRGNG